jgi:hypothetical protein
MANSVLYLSGVIYWAKVDKPDPKYGNYTLDLFLDDESMQKFKLSGLGLKIRPAKDGEGEFIKLRRAQDKIYNGSKKDLGPPALKIQDGVDDAGEPIFVDLGDRKIGNGSTGICKIRVYDTDKGKGHELLAVAVTSLIEYEPMEGEGEYAF